MSKQIINQQSTIELAIVRVKTIAFKTNEALQIPEGHNTANINIGTQTSVDIENNLVAINIKVTFTPLDDHSVYLIEGDFQTIFAIKDLIKWKNPTIENEILLPDEVNYTMLTISLSHSRALLSFLSANGSFQHLIMPLLTKEWIEKELMKKT